MLRFLLTYKSSVLTAILLVLIMYFVLIVPEQDSASQSAQPSATSGGLAPGAARSPIHSVFALGTTTISAPLDDRRTVRIATTSTPIMPNQPQPEEPLAPTPSEPTVAESPSAQPETAPKPETPAPTPTVDIAEPPAPSAAPTQTTEGGVTPWKWGVYTGANPGAIAEFESRVETNPDYLAYFVHWGNGGGALPAWLRGVAADKGRTLVLFWEASDYIIGGTDQPAYSYDRIIAGDWDDYFVDFAAQLRDYPGPVILVPFSELNGNWTPWSGTVNGNTPEKAVAAWRHVHGFVGNLPDVQIGLAYNAASVPNTPENQHENYYPGSAYVDIVGVDGFNDGPPWYSFEEIFTPPLDKLSRYGKPMMIFSFASAEGPTKDDWMREGFYEVMPRYPGLVGWVWFNQNKERNWLLWSDDEAFEVFKDAIGE